MVHVYLAIFLLKLELDSTCAVLGATKTTNLCSQGP